MKRILCLLLSLVLIGASAVSCRESDFRNNTKTVTTTDKGAVIPVYLTTEIYDFDPATAYTDEAATKILSMIYEGLYKYDKNGKVVPAIASGYKVKEDPEKGLYEIEIYLKETAWSDGRPVQAADFVYAIKRVLEPEFRGEAAALLMEIKNAKAVKAGEMSIDDLGVVDSDTKVIQIQFERKINYEDFLAVLASPLLYPIREDVVAKATDWSSNTSILVCNGPFVVRTFVPGKTLILERNIYYYRDVEDDPQDKYVKPYRLAVNFTMNAEEQFAAFQEGKLAFIGELPLSKRAEYKDQVKLRDTLTQHVYLFNTTKEPFNKPEVRRALSLAIDRQAIANKVVFATPAEGLITRGVFETTYKNKKQFRDVGGSLLSPSADLATAKSLLQQAGVNGGDITITLRGNEVDLAVAEMVAQAWGQLGFNVNIRKLGFSEYKENEYDLVSDLFKNAYASRDFDVIAVDITMFSTNPFGNLASFALEFSGGALDLQSGNFEFQPGVTGFNSPEYNEIIAKAFEETDPEKRAAILHDAEKMLLELAPVVPIFTYQDAYMVGDDLSGVKEAFYGCLNFEKAKLKNYEKYEETEPLETQAMDELDKGV
ncbi:MAG TPA: peptide ABC transporter substrate-binding protein [Bacillota bacterium]|nr:peptide ABC transporter substrate-binding protein [Bacillota bacterium]